MVKKRLYFYFYCFKGYKESRAIQIHLNCLKYYSQIFDESIFCLSLDDVNDKELIISVISDIINCGFKSPTFKIHKNSAYCESEPFYDDIICNLDKLDGITFFGHTKGISNYYGNNHNNDSIDKWITGLYYLSLDDIEFVERELMYYPNRFYGSFLESPMLDDDVHINKNNEYYAGTFFWINCLSVYNDLKINYIEELPKIHQRGYVENLSGNLYSYQKNEVSVKNDTILFAFDGYKNTDECIRFVLVEEYNKYIEYHNKMLENITSDK